MSFPRPKIQDASNNNPFYAHLRNGSTPKCDQTYVVHSENAHLSSIDAFLVSWDGKAAEVYGVQITIAKAHSNSEDSFFRSWQSWIEELELPEEKIKFGFLWIVEDRRSWPSAGDVPEKSVSIRGQTKVVCSAFKRRVVSVPEVDLEIGRKLKAARERIHRQ